MKIISGKSIFASLIFLIIMSFVVNNFMDDSNFEEKVLKSDKPVLVDFWAAWCGPCRMVGPIIDELSNEYEGKAVVGKVDIDSNQQYAAQFGVRNIPTVLIFKNGELIDRKVGVSSIDDFKKSYLWITRKVNILSAVSDKLH